MSLRLGSTLTLVVSTPEVAKEFVKTHERFFASRPSTAGAEYMTYNYSGIALTPYGPSWRHLRKVCVLQLLSSKQIEHFRSIREEETSAMIRSLINISDHPVSNITKTASELTNALICRMAFGRKYSDQDLIGGEGIDSMIKETFLLAGSFNIGDYIPFLARMDLQGLNRRFKNIQKTYDYLLEKIINEHASHKNKPNAIPDLVDVLLAASAVETMEFKITRENIKAVINVYHPRFICSLDSFYP
jgi:cytochrome P450